MDQEFFDIPAYCPDCSSRTVIDGQFLYCKSKACPSKLSGTIRVWVERLGLLHWGDSLIDKLTDSDKVNSIGDLYKLSVKDISEFCSGMKVATKCHNQLHSQKSIPLQLMLSALNIQNLGIATATDIVGYGFNTIDKILDVTAEELEKVPNVGAITAAKIVEGINDRKDTILDLDETIDVVDPEGKLLSGSSFCITGNLSKPRKAVEKSIMDVGGTVKTSVGSGLSYLITNNPGTTSSKMKKAEKLGVKVISEVELFKMLE